MAPPPSASPGSTHNPEENPKPHPPHTKKGEPKLAFKEDGLAQLLPLPAQQRKSTKGTKQ